MSELKIEELKAAALAAMPIDTELYGARHFDSYYSHVDLTKEQDAFITLAIPATILALIERLQVAEDSAKRIIDDTRWQVGTSIESDFKELTWTFKMQPTMRVSKGQYFLTPVSADDSALLSTDTKNVQAWAAACREIINRCVAPDMYANAMEMLERAICAAIATRRLTP